MRDLHDLNPNDESGAMNESRPDIRPAMRPAPHKAGAWLRIASLIGVGIVAIVLVTGLVAPYFLDVDRYRGDIAAQLSVQTGRPVTLGKIRAQVFPQVGFTVDAFHMGNPRGFAPGEFMSAAGIRGTLAFWPLVLRREIRIKSIDFIRPKLMLLQDQHDANNYTFSPGASASTETGATPHGSGTDRATRDRATTDRAGAQSGAPRLARGSTIFQIERVTLRDAEVIFGEIVPDVRNMHDARDVNNAQNVHDTHIKPTVDATGFDVTLRHLTPDPAQLREWQADAKLERARFTLAGWDGPIAFRSGTATLHNGRLESLFSADFGKAARVNGTFSIADIEHAVVKFDLHTDDVDLDALVAGATMKPFGIPTDAAPGGTNSSKTGLDSDSSPTSPRRTSAPPTSPSHTSDKKIAAPPPAAVSAVPSNGAPVAAPANAATGELLAEGHVSAERVRSGPQIAGPATADLRLYTGRMEIWPVTTRFAGGSVQISARTDRQQSPQRFSINVQARNLNVNEIVVTSAALRGKFAGTGEFDLQLFGSIDDAWEKSLTGKGQFAIRNGRIAGLSLYGAAQSLTNVAAASGDTTFTAITGDATIGAEHIDSGDMHLDSPRGTVDLRGSCGFDGSLNYDGQVTVPMSAQSAGLGPGPETGATHSGAASPPEKTQPKKTGAEKTQIKNGKLTIQFMLHGTLQNPAILPGTGKTRFAAPGQLPRQKSDTSFPNLFQK